MMKKKLLLSLIVIIIGIFACGAMCASAETYGYLTYKISDGEVTITDCNESATSVRIPNKINGYPVTSIGDSAFYYCTRLSSIEIPNSVTNIGDAAFCGCTRLSSIEIPDSVTSIGDSAFCSCSSLSSIQVDTNNNHYASESGVLFNKNKTTLICYPAGKTGSEYTIPDSVTSIGDYAFRGCDSLSSITIGNGVTSIGDSAFEYCYSLSSIVIPDSVTSIGTWAFYHCTRLSSIVIPDSVTSIGESAFHHCSSLSSIEIPDSVTSIGDSAFYYCTRLSSIQVDTNNNNYTSENGVLFNKNKTELICYPACKTGSEYTIPDSVTSIGTWAFYYCTRLSSIEIPDSVTSIGAWAFSECYSLSSVTIGDSVTSIGDSAFRYCSSLSSIEIPDSVTSIGEWAFHHCDRLSSITIGNSVTSIGDDAFYYCSSLKDVYYGGTKEQWNNISIGSNNDKLKNATIHYNYADKRITKLALSKAVYYDFKKGDIVGNLNKWNSPMFLTDNNKTVVTWNTFIKKYAGNMKVIEVRKEKEFFGAAFQDKSGKGDIIIAYRGTKERADLFTDAKMAVGKLDYQFKEALTLYNDVKKANEGVNIELTGHSLGGALASYVSVHKNVRTDNINGATGWMMNNIDGNLDTKNLSIESFVNYKGSADMINEMYAESVSISNAVNNLVVFDLIPSFNYTVYKNPKYKLPRDDWWEHSVASVLDYNNGNWNFTQTVKNYQPGIELCAGLTLGTEADDSFKSDVYQSSFFTDTRTGKLIAPGNFEQRNELLNDSYIVPGNADNSNKKILCGDGNDSVQTFAGNDIVVGGEGNDTLNCGAGDDTYYFGNNWGKDVITDVSGKDMLIFTDTPMSEITIEGYSDYFMITAGSNSVKIMKTGRQIKGSSMKIKASGEVSGDIFTMNLNSENAEDFVLEEASNAAETGKTLFISGKARLEVYDFEGNLIVDINNSEGSYVLGNYGEITAENGDKPFIYGVFTQNEYEFVITSDETVVCTFSSDADVQSIDNLSSVVYDMPAGAKLTVNTEIDANKKAQFKLVKEEETTSLDNIEIESVNSISITPEKDVVYTGETIALETNILPQNALISELDWQCESDDGGDVVINESEGKTTLTGVSAGTVKIKGMAVDGSGVYDEITVVVKSDPAPNVVMTAGDETYVSGEVATSYVKINVEDVEGYETIIEGDCELKAEENCYYVMSDGEHTLNIYGKNKDTNAYTQMKKIVIVQEIPKVTVTVAENDSVEGNGKTFTIATDAIGKTVVLALYNGDKFVSMQHGIYNGENLIFNTTDSYTNAKVFVWNDLENITPAYAAEIVK